MITVNENYIIDKKGNTTNVILKKKDYDKILKYIEELEDITAYDRAKNECGKATQWKKIYRDKN